MCVTVSFFALTHTHAGKGPVFSQGVVYTQQSHSMPWATYTVHHWWDGGAATRECCPAGGGVWDLTLFACCVSQSMLPSIKKDFPNELIDPECYFAALIAQNVRVVLCVTPAWSLLNNEALWVCGVCVCVCVCALWCVCACMHVCMCACMYMRLCMWACVHVSVFVCVSHTTVKGTTDQLKF